MKIVWLRIVFQQIPKTRSLARERTVTLSIQIICNNNIHILGMNNFLTLMKPIEELVDCYLIQLANDKLS